MSIHKESETMWTLGVGFDSVDIEATKEGLSLDSDTLPWDEIDKARAVATNKPTIERLMQLLAHAVSEADGWYDDARGGQIEGDAMIDEARKILNP